MSLLCGTPGGSVDKDATRVTMRDPGRNEALWITARAEKCLWIVPGIPVLLTGKLLEGLVAVPVGGGRARVGLEIDHSEPSGSRVAISRAGCRPPARTAARLHRFGGRRRDRRARAGFETRHRAKRGCLVSRAAGASGAWKTRGAKSNMRNHAGPPPPARTAARSGEADPEVCRAAGPCGTNSSRGLVSRTWEGPGIRRRTRGRRLLPHPRPCRLFPRSCAAGRRSR